MSANIFGDRFLGFREPAWHALGTVFTEPITATESVLRGKMDYRVGLRPISVEGIGRADGYAAIVRDATLDDPQARVFGVASKDYQVLQNADIARIVEPLAAHWPVETVAALGHGETFFLSLDAGMDEVGGEAVHKYFLAVDSKTGKKAFRLAFTPVRVVCQNTLITGLRAATVSGIVEHVRGVEDMITLRVDAMSRLVRAQDETMALLRQMAATNIMEADLNTIIEAAYPLPCKPKAVSFAEDILGDKEFGAYLAGMDAIVKSGKSWEYMKERQEGFRSAAKGLLVKFQQEQPKLALTPWASFNAVVETEDYRRGWEGNAWAEDALFGGRAKSKAAAFDAAIKLL